MTLLIDLQAKAEEIRFWYRNIYEDISLRKDPVQLTSVEKKVSESAIRWHINSHIRFIGEYVQKNFILELKIFLLLILEIFSFIVKIDGLRFFCL
jgi:hypothetical protein